jgi:hypothetical protein
LTADEAYRRAVAFADSACTGGDAAACGLLVFWGRRTLPATGRRGTSPRRRATCGGLSNSRGSARLKNAERRIALPWIDHHPRQARLGHSRGCGPRATRRRQGAAMNRSEEIRRSSKRFACYLRGLGHVSFMPRALGLQHQLLVDPRVVAGRVLADSLLDGQGLPVPTV